MTRIVALLVFVAAVAACRRDAACREVCTKYGIDAASEQCTMMCNTDCQELADKFGISIDQCKAMQRGEPR
jgi:hypothetical protein